MTEIGTEDVPGHWLTAAELARASYLREDQVERFLPATPPQENLYSRDLVSVARFVKVLTDLGTPTAAVEVAVTELRARPDAAFSVALGSGSNRARLYTKRMRSWKAVGATTAAALLIGGVAAVALSGRDDAQAVAVPAPTNTANAAKPVPAEAVAPAAIEAPAALAFASALPDPICVQWQRASAGYDAKQQAWAKSDPRVPAARWSPKQRDVTMAVIPVMREEAAELRSLADKAKDPLLAGLLRGQSRYVENYAARLPKFQPGDQVNWTAATALGGAVKAICSTPR